MINNIRELTLAQIQTLCEGASHMDDLLILTDHFPRTPLSSPLRMGCVMISLCTSGTGHYTINAKDYEFKPHDFLLLSEGQILTGYHVSDDFSGLSFIVSPELTEEIIKGVQNLSQLFMFFRSLLFLTPPASPRPLTAHGPGSAPVRLLTLPSDLPLSLPTVALPFL